METNKINIFGRIASVAMGILMVLSAVLIFPYILSHAQAASAPVASESTLTVDTADIVVDAQVNPDGTSTFFKATSNLTISTNNYSGYTLRIVAEDEDTHDRLINTLAGSYLESITEATSEQDFKDEATFLGKFGYSPSKLGSSENMDFLPAPDTTGDVLDATNAANSGEGEENTYSISLGAKVDITIPSGEYVNTYIYEVVANPVPYLITFDENTTDTVTNMPSTQQDDATSDNLELDSATPERAHYDFLGWCEGTTTNTVTEQDDIYTCDGTVYQPGDTFYLDQTSNNLVELKAMWEIHKNRLDINGRLDGSDAGNIANYGTVDVYINGNLVADDTTDYAVYWKYGTTYEVTDIKTNTGKQYDGVQTSFPLSGTIEEDYVDLRLIFSTTVYSISYTLNNGTVSPANPTTYTVDTNTFTLTNPTRTGYTFKGWSGTDLTGDENTTVTISKGSTGNRSYTANWTINRYYLDLNGWLDGASSGNISGFGTADIYVNGTQVANDVADWYQQYDYGSTYTINDIKTATGKEYKGVYSGSLTGTITSNVGVFLQYNTKQYSVQLVANNGSGGTTKTVNHGSTVQFTNVKPNSNYNDTNSISCTNSQSASKSGTTVTTGAITNNTVCTISFPIKTYSVKLTVTGGSGGGTTTVNHGSATTFSNVKPDSSHNDTNTVTCTGGTASKSGTNVTTGAITATTECTINFPIKTYSVQLKVTNGSGATTKTVNHGSTTSFSVSASSGYTYYSLSCTNSQSASISGNTVTTGAITNNTVCTLTYTDQTTPTVSVISGHYDYYDNSTYVHTNVSFGGSGGSVSCVNQSNGNAAVNTVKSLGALGRNTVKCVATGNNGKTKEATGTIYVDIIKMTGNNMQRTTTCGSYTSGTNLVLKAKCSAGYDWQYGPYVPARAGTYKVTYSLTNIGGSEALNGVTWGPAYNAGTTNLPTTGGYLGNFSHYYNFTVPSGGISDLEVRIGNAGTADFNIAWYAIESQ